MMNCDLKKRAGQLIEVITAKLDHELISRRIHEPIDEVAGAFEWQEKYPISHKEFHKTIADFVREIYDKALKASWMLTNPLDEAIWLLENSYHSALYGPGYTGAILHANNPAGGGIQTVLTGLAEAIKDIEQQKYINGVLTWHLHGCSWPLLCEIAQILLEDYRPFIPPQLCKCVPAQLVDEIPEIMYSYVCSDFTLQGISFRRSKSMTTERLFGRGML